MCYFIVTYLFCDKRPDTWHAPWHLAQVDKQRNTSHMKTMPDCKQVQHTSEWYHLSYSPCVTQLKAFWTRFQLTYWERNSLLFTPLNSCSTDSQYLCRLWGQKVKYIRISLWNSCNISNGHVSPLPFNSVKNEKDTFFSYFLWNC